MGNLDLSIFVFHQGVADIRCIESRIDDWLRNERKHLSASTAKREMEEIWLSHMKKIPYMPPDNEKVQS